jgi:hypothetical protein
MASPTASKIVGWTWLLLALTGLGTIVIRTAVLLGSAGQLINTFHPSPATALYGERRLGQTFVAARPGLERVDVLMYGSEHKPGPIVFHLGRAEKEQDLVTITFDAGERWGWPWGWQWKDFTFAPLPDSAGQLYSFYLESPTSTPDNAMNMGGIEGDAYLNGAAFINGHPARADGAFRSFYADMSVADKLSALAAGLTEDKPFIWGDGRFYVLLAVIYLALMGGLGWHLFKLSLTPAQPETVDEVKDGAGGGR